MNTKPMNEHFEYVCNHNWKIAEIILPGELAIDLSIENAFREAIREFYGIYL